MKKILLIADCYHPDSSATTNLFRRTMEALAKLNSVAMLKGETIYK